MYAEYAYVRENRAYFSRSSSLKAGGTGREKSFFAGLAPAGLRDRRSRVVVGGGPLMTLVRGVRLCFLAEQKSWPGEATHDRKGKP